MTTIQRTAGFRSPQALRRILPPLVFLAIAASIWQVGAVLADSILLPTFTSTVGAFVDIVVGGALWAPLARSNVTMFLGFFISAAVGVPIGLILGRRRTLDHLAAPWIAVLVVMPASALLPIIVMMVGFDIVGGVTVVILFALVYIVVNTRAGIRSIEPHLVEMAYSYGAREIDIWRFVLVPGALPAIATGLRIGLGRAFSGMVLAELLLFASGIGLLILQYRGQFAADHLFAVILALLVEAVLLGFVMRLIERRVKASQG